MNRFEDELTRQICETRFGAGVPEHVSVAAHEKIRIMMAACGWQDVGMLGAIIRLPNAPDRYGLQIHGKWHVTFAWSNDIGVYDIRLERR